MTQKLGIVDKQNTNIEVFIRIKPTPEHDLLEPTCVNVQNEKQITMSENQKGQTHTFSFDRIFNNNSSQQEIYQQVTKNMIDNAFEGINSTVFCYGQTCSGKTYTCIGKNLQDQEQKGLAPRIMQQILKRKEGVEKHIQLKMRISIVQIHNQKIRDLLDHTKNNLKIRADKGRGVFLQNVTQKYILSQQEARHYLSKGAQHRSQGSTGMNSVSSRSHMILTINVHQLNLYTGLAKKAKITLVDLAGSEKLLRTGSEGKLIFETKKINTSLSTLGKVINILSQGRKMQHVPYRQSKLTRLLQQSLGGNSITKLIINISPAKLNYNQTLSSLRFGTRAKAIQNEPKINKQYTVPQLLELLHKAQRKIKILTQVIKQIMKEKGNQSMTFKEFVKIYLVDQGNGYESNESEHQALPKKVIESISKRNSFKSIEKLPTKRQYNLDSARSMKSFASIQPTEQKYIIKKNLLNTIPKIQPEKPCQRLLKSHRSAEKSRRNLIKSIQLTPLALNIKRKKGISKQKNNDIDNFLSQRDIKHNDSQESSIELQKNSKKKGKSSDSIKSSWCKSNAKSACSINSRVLDLNVYNQSITKIKRFTLQLGEVQSVDNGQYREDSIEFNIQKIKQNFKKIESIRLKALIS